eukprot:TRINITY_DN76_c1_g2_i1.p1 TRINITY_DN76_c1_g2~~TRINITY_DN76_c1_g2_i1.p1  ORF type:complete len:304 (+),score=30.31 TRINITY_DN76_c1_g2_i1:34-912(+)
MSARDAASFANEAQDSASISKKKRWNVVKRLTSNNYFNAIVAEDSSGHYVMVKHFLSPADLDCLGFSKHQFILLKEAAQHRNVVYHAHINESPNHLMFFYGWDSTRGTLYDHYKKSGPIPDAEARRFTRHILKGLDHIHSLGIPHGCLKCATVAISDKGVAKLFDLGLPTLEVSLTISGDRQASTKLWVAPEILAGHQVNAQSDIWAVGCTVMEMLTADVPFSHLFQKSQGIERETKKIVTYLADKIGEIICPAIDPVACDFIRCCLVRDPAKRPSAVKLLRHKFVNPDGHI